MIPIINVEEANFTGNGAGVTNLDGTKIQAGTINSNSLDTLTKAQLALAATGGGATSIGTNSTDHNQFIYDTVLHIMSGAMLTNVNLHGSSYFTNAASHSYLAYHEGGFNGSNGVTGSWINTTNDSLVLSNAQTGNFATVTNGSITASMNITSLSGIISGNGAGLNTLNASTLSSGTLPDARLSANVPQLNGVNTFSGASNVLTGGIGFAGSSPTIVTNGGFGTGGTITGISGNNAAFHFTVNSGASVVASTNFCTVTFVPALTVTPTVIVYATGSDGTSVINFNARCFVANVSNTGFTIMVGSSAASSSKIWQVNVWCPGL